MTHLIEHLLSVPGWLVLLIAGGLVLVEDALFVGFVVPGETVAVLAGVAAQRGHVALAAVLVTVVLAAIVGDSIGYEVGRTLGTRLLSWHRLDKHRGRLDDAQDLLARRGGVAVFLGRFVAFFRAVMPALSGAARMRYLTFLLFNALGGLVWGCGVVMVGYLAGASYAKVEHTVGRGAAIAVGAIVVVGLVVWRVRAHRAERRKEHSEGSPEGEPRERQRATKASSLGKGRS